MQKYSINWIGISRKVLQFFTAVLLLYSIRSCVKDESNLSNLNKLLSVSVQIKDSVYQAENVSKGAWYIKVPSSVEMGQIKAHPRVVASPNTDVLMSKQMDYSKPVPIAVVAQNYDTAYYSLLVQQDKVTQGEQSKDNMLRSVSFNVGSKTFYATPNNKGTWFVSLPKGTDLSNLAHGPDLQINAKSSYSPKNQTDFSKPVKYTVLAENGTKAEYVFNVTHIQTEAEQQANTKAEIESVWFVINYKVFFAVEDAHGFKVELPHDVDLAKLNPPVLRLSDGATVTPLYAKDFSSPVTYTVTSASGNTKQFSVRATKAAEPTDGKSNEAKINEVWFVVNSRVYMAVQDIRGFHIKLPSEVDLSNLHSPVIRVSDEAKYTPKGVSDFSSPVQYTVIAANGDTQRYKLYVTKAKVGDKGSQVTHKAEIEELRFVIDHKVYSAIEDSRGYKIKLPHDVDLTNLPSPVIRMSEGATISPQNVTDFSSAVNYTVTSADGSKLNIYKLEVTKEVNQSGEKKITNLTLTSGGKSYTALQVSHDTYNFKLPHGTDLSNLPTPTIGVSSHADYIPKGQTDFSSPVRYTVTAQDGTSTDYYIKATFLPNKSTDVQSIVYNDSGSQIRGRKMANGDWIISLPNSHTNLASLSSEPVFTLPAKANYYPKGMTDFSRPVKYTVVAESGETNSFRLHFAKKFVSKWRTTRANETVQLPLTPKGDYDFVVNWGDGKLDTITNAKLLNAKHIYPNPNPYTVTIDGLIRGFGFNDPNTYASRPLIIDVSQWGTLQLGAIGHHAGAYFSECLNFNISANDAPDLSTTTNLSNMFAGRRHYYINFNSNINHWDVSHVTNMAGMFQFTRQFNQPLDDWDVHNVTHMQLMFTDAQKFNQKIGHWNTSRVVDMWGMFAGALDFNQDISRWSVERVTDMKWMFYLMPSFAQDISNWDTRSVVNMQSMVEKTPLLKSDLRGWNVSKVYKWKNFNRESGVIPPAKFK